MRLYENGRWTGSCTVAKKACYEYTIKARTGEFGTWRAEVDKKVDAGQDVKPELVEGRGIVGDAFGRSHDRRLGETLAGFDDAGYEGRVALLRSEEVSELIEKYPDRSRSTVYGKTLGVVVDRERARFGAWYEMFPRRDRTAPAQDSGARLRRGLPDAHLPHR
jgi:starch synthase (maltosyl-transferring)